VSGSNYTFAYDCNGNMTTRSESGATYNQTWDQENRLTGLSGSGTATFVYDGDGNRVKATVNGVTTASGSRRVDEARLGPQSGGCL